jgi:2-polyprenyl-3-methyl-5-hydroxy-6-metoxy-1,4-benzoquinol methylase
MIHGATERTALPLCNPEEHWTRMVDTTIVAKEAEHFGKLAADWWDPNGSSAMLHKLGPVRLKYLRDQIDQHRSPGSTHLRK